MKKVFAFVLVSLFVFVFSGQAFTAKTVVEKTPKKKIVVVKKGVPKEAVIIKKGMKTYVVCKRYYYPKRQVIILGKQWWYRPWKWRARILVKEQVTARIAPNKDADTVVVIPKDKECEAYERADGWMLVKWENKQGWISKGSVKVLEVKEVTPAKGENLTEEEVEIETTKVEEGDTIIIKE